MPPFTIADNRTHSIPDGTEIAFSADILSLTGQYIGRDGARPVSTPRTLPSAPASPLPVIARNEAIQAQADTLHVYAHPFAKTTPCH
jgi:hypothetical protein